MTILTYLLTYLLTYKIINTYLLTRSVFDIMLMSLCSYQWVRPVKVKQPFFEINAINYKGSEKTSEKNNLGLSRKTTYKTSTYRD